MKNKNVIISDFEIVENNLLGINTDKLINKFLELFSSDPDNMSNSKYVNKLNNFLNEINSNYICVNKLSVNDEGEIFWKFKLK
jgi:hypothetical protein|tara:strand:- start:700 stop:948 length:249 start_codon:yes stop_codon:yes gene_type:complete